MAQQEILFQELLTMKPAYLEQIAQLNKFLSPPMKVDLICFFVVIQGARQYQRFFQKSQYHLRKSSCIVQGPSNQRVLSGPHQQPAQCHPFGLSSLALVELKLLYKHQLDFNGSLPHHDLLPSVLRQHMLCVKLVYRSMLLPQSLDQMLLSMRSYERTSLLVTMVLFFLRPIRKKKLGQLMAGCDHGNSNKNECLPGVRLKAFFQNLKSKIAVALSQDHGYDESNLIQLTQPTQIAKLSSSRRHPKKSSRPKRSLYVFSSVLRRTLRVMCLASCFRIENIYAKHSPLNANGGTSRNRVLLNPGSISNSFEDSASLKKASRLNDMGNIFLKQQDFESALQKYYSALKFLPNSLDIHKNILVSHLRLGDSMGVLRHTEKFSLNTLELSLPRRTVPSVHSLLGIALYNLNRMDKAQEAFRIALRLIPSDQISWSNFGDTLLHSYKVEDAVVAHAEAHRLTSMNDKLHGKFEEYSKTLSKESNLTAAALFRARGWMCDWENWFHLGTRVAKAYSSSVHLSDLKSYGDFIDVPASVLRKVNTAHSLKIYEQHVSGFKQLHIPSLRIESRPLRVGFLSSDFGVHPVSSLIRGLMAELSRKQANSSIVETFVYILTDETSWWRENITQTVHHTNDLFGMSTEACAGRIKSDGLDVLIDLNGWTMHGGLNVLAYRVAPIQAMFLGYSMSTGAPFVDYFIVDPSAVPVEEVEGKDGSFSEKLILLPHSFFANDYASLQPHVVWANARTAASRRSEDKLKQMYVPRTPHAAGLPLPQRFRPYPTVLFACFSDFRKMDPLIFEVWMNMLRSVPGSVLWILRHHKISAAEQRLRMEAASRGVRPDRLVFTNKVAWIDHIIVKGVADLVLDTRLVNGHTISADALWGGVPVLTIQGKRMGSRVASSLLKRGLDSVSAGSTGLNGLVSMCLREYESISDGLCSRGETAGNATTFGRYQRHRRRRHLLRGIRRRLQHARLHQPLFRMKGYTLDFESQLRAAVELKSASQSLPNIMGKAHLYLPPHYTHKRMLQKPMEVAGELPKDPDLTVFYRKFVAKGNRYDVVLNKSSSDFFYTPDSSHGLILLHITENMFNSDVDLEVSPEGWQSTLMEAFQEGRARNSSVTAIYATLSGKWAGLIFLEQSHLALRPGGALFLHVEKMLNKSLGVTIQSQLEIAGFCNITKIHSPFGSFDIRKSMTSSECLRYTAKVCRKSGRSVNVRIQ